MLISFYTIFPSFRKAVISLFSSMLISVNNFTKFPFYFSITYHLKIIYHITKTYFSFSFE